MAVLDSSALIPLARVGRLELVSRTFDALYTTDAVREEVTTEGKRGSAVLAEFLEDVSIQNVPSGTEDVAEKEGITTTDASVIILANERDGILSANDKGLIETARSHNVESWWVTTLLLKNTKDGTLTADESESILYDLVDEGMNLHPKIYTKVQKKLRKLEP